MTVSLCPLFSLKTSFNVTLILPVSPLYLKFDGFIQAGKNWNERGIVEPFCPLKTELALNRPNCLKPTCPP